LFFGLQIVIQNTVVEGSSMHPNFQDSEHLLVNKLAYRTHGPERGDVVVFRSAGPGSKDFIKRIIGLPGETVSLENGRVYIDGQRLEEPWQPSFDRSDYPRYKVPEGHYFVLGDNRGNSNDSRVFGTPFGSPGLTEPGVPADRLVGRVWLSIWPANMIGVVRADSPAPSHP
jgi:signal peptidase I